MNQPGTIRHYKSPESPLVFTAWQLIGWEGDHGTLRKKGGRAIYSDVMFQCDTPGEHVKIARLDAGPREVCQWVKPETLLEIVTITKDGEEFLRFQELMT